VDETDGTAVVVVFDALNVFAAFFTSVPTTDGVGNPAAASSIRRSNIIFEADTAPESVTLPMEGRYV
jgi:hypothetical protein